MKICIDFGPYDAFPSSDVPEMVHQQNTWNSLVIGTYLLYPAWNVGMLAVNICILWPPTTDALFFMLACTQNNFHKKRASTRYTELVFFASRGIYGSRSAFRYVEGVNRPCTIFHAHVGPVWFPQKVCQDVLCQTCVFASGVICESHSAFWCIWAWNADALFFMLGWDWYGFNKKCAETCYAKHVFCIQVDLPVT
jgi:hypothetical protein